MKRMYKLMLAGLAGTGVGVGVGYGFLEAGAVGEYTVQREKFMEEAPGKPPFTDCQLEQTDLGSETLTKIICPEGRLTALNQAADKTAQKAKDSYREANRASAVGGATALVGGLATILTFVATADCVTLVPEISTHELEEVIVEEKTSPKKPTHKLTLNERLKKTKSTRPIPVDFIDPAHKEMMDKPMLLESTYSIDERTLNQLVQRICPITRIPIRNPIFNRALFNAMEKFVMEEEASAALRLRRADRKFICPLTQDIMTDPVIASDGGIYEREAILDRINQGNLVSPLNNGIILQPIDDSGYVKSDEKLRNQITGYLKFEERLAQNRLEKEAKWEETVPLTRSMSQNRL